MSEENQHIYIICKPVSRQILFTLEGQNTHSIWYGKLRKFVTGSNTTLNTCLAQLELINLIRSYKEKKFHLRKYFYLTGKGRQIVKQLHKIENFLEEPQ